MRIYIPILLLIAVVLTTMAPKGLWAETDEFQIIPGIMPLPESRETFAPPLAPVPVLNAEPTLANPIGLGSVAMGGGTLDIRVRTVGFSGLADVYFAVFSPEALGNDIFLYTGETFVVLSQAGLLPWIAGTSGQVDQDLFGEISVSSLPSGTYTLFLAVAPAGSPLGTFYLWSSAFTVP